MPGVLKYGRQGAGLEQQLQALHDHKAREPTFCSRGGDQDHHYQLLGEGGQPREAAADGRGAKGATRLGQAAQRAHCHRLQREEDASRLRGQHSPPLEHRGRASPRQPGTHRHFGHIQGVHFQTKNPHSSIHSFLSMLSSYYYYFC